MKKQKACLFSISLAVILNYLVTCQPAFAKELEEPLLLTDMVEGELTKDDDRGGEGYLDEYILDLKNMEEKTEAFIVLESADFIPELYLLDAETGEFLEKGQGKFIKNS